MRLASIRIGHVTIFVYARRSKVHTILKNVYRSWEIPISFSLKKQKAIKPQRIDFINRIIADTPIQIDPTFFPDGIAANPFALRGIVGESGFPKRTRAAHATRGVGCRASGAW